MCSERNAGIQRSDGVQLGDPLLRGRAEQRQPQPAVGGEALLRREVVGVGLGDVDGQPAGAGGRVDQRRARRRRRPGAARAPSRRSRSRCAPTRSRRRRSAACAPTPAGSGASPGSAATTIGSPQERRAGGDGRELLRELAVDEVQRAALAPARTRPRPRRPSRRRCRARPRSRRAGRTARAAGADLADERLDRLLAVRGAHHRRASARPGARAPPGAPSTDRSRSARRRGFSCSGITYAAARWWGWSSSGLLAPSDSRDRRCS